MRGKATQRMEILGLEALHWGVNLETELPKNGLCLSCELGSGVSVGGKDQPLVVALMNSDELTRELLSSRGHGSYPAVRVDSS